MFWCLNIQCHNRVICPVCGIACYSCWVLFFHLTCSYGLSMNVEGLVPVNLCLVTFY